MTYDWGALSITWIHLGVLDGFGMFWPNASKHCRVFASAFGYFWILLESSGIQSCEFIAEVCQNGEA